jgi:hypothetical protein
VCTLYESWLCLNNTGIKYHSPCKLNYYNQSTLTECIRRADCQLSYKYCLPPSMNF